MPGAACRKARRKRSRQPTRARPTAVRIRAGRPSGLRCWSQNVNRFFKIFVSAATTFGHAPRAAQVGMFLFFAASVSDGILMPFFALWAHKDAGIPIEFIGLLLGCYAGGELLATPFFGGIADRVGRRPVLLVSTTGVGLGFLLLFMVRGAFAVAGALIVIGVFESVLHPTASTVIADVVPADARREHFAARRVMSNAGSMARSARFSRCTRWGWCSSALPSRFWSVRSSSRSFFMRRDRAVPQPMRRTRSRSWCSRRYFATPISHD